MPPTHRIILKWISYIPSGSWSSFPHLRDWMKSHAPRPSSIRSIPPALKKSCIEYGLELYDVPVHRFIEAAVGTTHWGDHLWEVFDLAERRELLEAEGNRFDCNGRILGAAFRLESGHEMEDIVGSRNSVNAQEGRMQDARDVCDAAKLDGSNPKRTAEWLALDSYERMLMYRSGYQWVTRFDY